MAAGYTDPLLARADKAIADAIATRKDARAGLIAAWHRRPYRPHPHERPSPPDALEPMDWGALEPWWSVARTLGSASEVVRTADLEQEREWQRILPTIETPSALLCD